MYHHFGDVSLTTRSIRLFLRSIYVDHAKGELPGSSMGVETEHDRISSDFLVDMFGYSGCFSPCLFDSVI